MDNHTTDRSFGLRLECEQITRRQVCMIIEPLSLTDDAVMAGLGSVIACSAVRTTLVGSTMPVFTRSLNSPACASDNARAG
jgi:hypothetical protein